jgi:hypothetical protein
MLTGGTLGNTVGAFASIQLRPTSGFNGNPTFPLYMGPGNGADYASVSPSSGQAAVQVPTPGGEAFHLQVKLSSNPGPAGSEYTFIVCNEIHGTGANSGNTETNCDETALSCEIADAAQTCSNDTGETEYLPGDTIVIQAFSSENSTANTVAVSWSLDYAIGSFDPI